MTRCYWWPTAARGSWDQGIVEELTAGFDHDPEGEVDEGAVVVIAGQHALSGASLLADLIYRLPWCLSIVTSDEEAAFPIDLLPSDAHHETWVQYHARPEAARVIPIGLPPNSVDLIENFYGDDRDLDVFFAGQNTHARREELIDTMKQMACEPGNGNISWVATTGFRAGLDKRDYLAALTRTKIAPCPSGYHSLDSFRLYEAIVAGALPVIETHTPDGEESAFWRTVFGKTDGFPIPWVESWADDFPLIVECYRDPETWQRQRDKVQRWWADYRTGLATDFTSTIERLKG